MERGLLDLSVALSTRDITAGNQFALFVIVKNPFDKPVWIRRVHVSLPSELKLAQPKKSEQEQKVFEKEKQNKLKEAEDKQIRLENKLETLQNALKEFVIKLENNSNDGNIQKLINKIEEKIFFVQDELKGFSNLSTTNVLISGKASMGNLKIASRTVNIRAEDDFEIGHLEIFEPELYRDLRTQTRTIELESSLPENTALQPGSTVVNTALLFVEKSLVFTPSQYRLQFNVNYSFTPKNEKKLEEYNNVEEELFTNTIAHELSIRPSVYSVIIGSALGGFFGAIARFLQVTPPMQWQTLRYTDILSFGVAIILAVILSCVAIVFMARKSESQSFVSVEDFWGGLLIGFFVGYTGASFFETLTGIPNPVPSTQNTTP